MARTPATPPTPETKREKFVRLAESRVGKAIAQMEIVGSIANRKEYEFSEEDVARINAALVETTAGIKQKFDDALAGKAVKVTTGFSLASEGEG